jgi:hypothetical protein
MHHSLQRWKITFTWWIILCEFILVILWPVHMSPGLPAHMVNRAGFWVPRFHLTYCFLARDPGLPGSHEFTTELARQARLEICMLINILNSSCRVNAAIYICNSTANLYVIWKCFAVYLYIVTKYRYTRNNK